MQTNEPTTAGRAISEAYAEFTGAGTTPQLRPIRDRAIEAFARSGFPTVRDEDWKYTNLTDVEARSADYLSAGSAAADIEAVRGMLSELPIDAYSHTIVFANGLYREDLSSPPAGDVNLSIETLRGSNERSSRRIGEELGRIADVEKFQLAALNTAFLNDALSIRVPEGCEVPKPIHVVFVSDEQRVSVQSRILIDVGCRGRVTLIEHHVGRGAGLTNAVTEASCGEGAQLSYIKIQEASTEAYHLAAQYVQLGRDSVFDAVHLDFGARLARNDLTVRLSGNGGETRLHGLFVVDGERHVDHHTRVDHFTEHTTSRESYRGILADKGRGVFNGKVVVHPGADQSDAELNNRNLLLSPMAEIDTKPELEIYTDDVKCGHGTTTGRLDSDALFYLRSRGVPEDEARRLLVLAFAADTIDRIGVAGDKLAQHIRDALDKRLPG